MKELIAFSIFLFAVIILQFLFKLTISCITGKKFINLKNVMGKTKLLLLALMVIFLSSCATVNRHGLHGSKYIYHQHDRSHHVNRNGLYK